MKIITIIFHFLLIITQTNAHTFSVFKENEDVILEAKDCSNETELRDIYASLKQWTTSIESEVDCPNFTFKKDSTNCQIDITKCVPKHVKKYQDVNPAFSGPNCWNLALVMKEILPGLRYSSADEMSFYMGPPLCRNLKNGEALKPGDVGAIRNIHNNKIQESHGFIYISDKIAYSKNGFHHLSPYALQSLDNVYQTYDVPDKAECRKNQIDLDNDCDVAVSYYRCISLSQYLKENPNVPKEVLTTLENVSLFEGCALTQNTIEGIPVSGVFKALIKSSVQALTEFLISQKKKVDKSKRSNDETDFILGSLQLRLKAISDQLKITPDNELTYDVLELRQSFDKAAKNFKR